MNDCILAFICDKSTCINCNCKVVDSDGDVTPLLGLNLRYKVAKAIREMEGVAVTKSRAKLIEIMGSINYLYNEADFGKYDEQRHTHETCFRYQTETCAVEKMSPSYKLTCPSCKCFIHVGHEPGKLLEKKYEKMIKYYTDVALYKLTVDLAGILTMYIGINKNDLHELELFEATVTNFDAYACSKYELDDISTDAIEGIADHIRTSFNKLPDEETSQNTLEEAEGFLVDILEVLRKYLEKKD